nr:unnamed protein product [Spirometra erinaceieuropaei]
MMSKLIVGHWDQAVDGVLSRKTMEAKMQKEGYSCIPYTFNPGMVFGEHSHNVDKKDVVVSGELEFTMFGETVVLKDGDTLVVPKGVPHSARVVGSRPVEFFDATKM